MVLDGTDRPGRYNRPGQRTLYLSGSRAGVVAAMARYEESERTLVRVEVAAERLIDLRDPSSARALGFDASVEDWQASLGHGREPASWTVSDRAREHGVGLLERSRRAPAEWHLVLFRWNEPDGAQVDVVAGEE